MKRTKSRLCFVLSLVLVMSLVIAGLTTISVADGPESPIFTVTLVPQAKETNILTAVTDADAGELVKMDVMLKNSSDAAVSVNAFTLELSLPDTLTYTGFQRNGAVLAGTLSTAVRLSTGNQVFDYYSGGNQFCVDLDPNAEVRLITLELTVASSGITYADILTATLSGDTNFHRSNTITEDYPDIVPAKLEIVTEYDITWTGMAGDDEITPVGIGLTPSHADAVKAGYTFGGWSPAIVAASADATYTAQWSPTSYTVAFAEGTSFGTGVTAPATYDIETPITVIPTKTGYNFKGWTAAPKTEGDTDYNWPTGLIALSDGFTNGYYGNVVLTPQWTVDAEAVFSDYAYAGHVGADYDKLLLVGLNTLEDGNAVYYGGELMFCTDDENYLALLNANGGSYTTVYVYIVPKATTAADAIDGLTMDTGTNTVIRRDGDVNGDSKVTSADFGIIDTLLLDSNGIDGITVQMRLEADVDTSPFDGYKFGSIMDIARVIQIKNS